MHKMKNIVIDLINLDHCYISVEKDCVYYDNEQRRLGNIRPYINNNRIDITNNDKYELITEENNPTDFTYESWLAVYVDKYIKYAKYEDGDNIVFIIPLNFDVTILSVVMSMLKLKFTYIYDFYGGVYLTCKHYYNYVILIPNEYNTTIIHVNNRTIKELNTIEYGSLYIKKEIQQYLNKYNINISLDDAWKIYNSLQINSTIDISQIVLSIENEVLMTRDVLVSLLNDFYNEIFKTIPNTFVISPFRWIGRDYVICKHYTLLKFYNIDEGICIGAQNYVSDGGKVNELCESEIDLLDLQYLNHYINLNNEFNILANKIDHFFIENNIEAIDIDLTKLSIRNCIKYLRKHNAPSELIRDTCKIFWNI